MTLQQKNDFMKLASRYPSSLGGIRLLRDSKEFRALFPHARIRGTVLDFGDGELVDILVAG